MNRRRSCPFVFLLIASVLAGQAAGAQQAPEGSLRDKIPELVGEYGLVDVRSEPGALAEGATDAIVATYGTSEGIEVTLLAYAFPSRESAERYLDRVIEDLRSNFGFQVVEEGTSGPAGTPTGRYARLTGTHEVILGTLSPGILGRLRTSWVPGEICRDLLHVWRGSLKAAGESYSDRRRTRPRVPARKSTRSTNGEVVHCAEKAASRARAAA